MAKVIREYFINGQLNSEYYEINGLKEGESKRYNKNSMLEETFMYVNGKSYGVNNFYSCFNGNLLETAKYVDNMRQGICIEYHYDNFAIKRQVNYIDNIAKCYVEQYYENGKLHSTYNVDGELSDSIVGEYKEYYQSGQLKIICNYSEDNWLNGEFKEYYENGKIKQICNYISHKIDGVCEIYSDTGELIAIENYVNGVLQNDEDNE